MNRWFDNIPLIGKKIPGKITLSFLMFLFAILMSVVFNTTDRITCVIAMFFSFVGDIALNHNRNHEEQSKKDFLVGGIAFIVAHIFYCITYYKKIKFLGYEIFSPGSYYAIMLLLLITSFMLLARIAMKKKATNSKLFIFGLIYLWITGINYMTIFSYSYSAKSIGLLAALGGILFLASDVIIGMEKFLGLKSKAAREAVWWLYPLGQIILIIMA